MPNISQPPNVTDPRFGDWLFRFWKLVSSLEAPATTSTTSTQDHALLQNLNSTTYAHPTQAQVQSLTSGADSVLHTHAYDRDRANHTGQQTAATISDFNQAVLQLIPETLDAMEVEGLQRQVSVRDIPDFPYVPSQIEIEQRVFAPTDVLLYRDQMISEIALSTDAIIGMEEFCNFRRT
jgi:hypothetical protein